MTSLVRFIGHHQSYLTEKNINLSDTDGISPEKIILYFVHLHKYQHSMKTEENSSKLFHPVPVHTVKRYNTIIDGEVLY